MITQSVIATSDWWNTNYGFRRNIDINSNHSSILSDYTYHMTINTEILIYDGKMKNDCNDLRIWSKTINNEIDRRVINCGTSSTEVLWHAQELLPIDIPNSNNYFIYYGNSLPMPELKNWKNIYWFVDEFNGETLDTSIWTNANNQSISVANGTAVLSSQSRTDYVTMNAPNYSIPYNTKLVGKIKASTSSGGGYFTMDTRVQTANQSSESLGNLTGIEFNGFTTPNALSFINYNGSWIEYGISNAYFSDQYRIYEVDFNSVSTKLTIDGQVATIFTNGIPSQNVMHPYILCWGPNSGANQCTYDYVYMQRYVTDEPELTLGQEEIGDLDGDGIVDSLDQCLNTPQGEVVDVNGCSCSQKTCNDNNLCTDDSCNESNAQCEFVNDNSNSCGQARDCPNNSCYLSNFPPHYLFQTYPIDGADYCQEGSCVQYSCDAITSNFEATCNPDYNQLTQMQGQITLLQSQLNQTSTKTNLIYDLLTFAGNNLKKTMICGYMNFSQQTQFTALGLTCQINNSTCTCYAQTREGGELVQ